VWSNDGEKENDKEVINQAPKKSELEPTKSSLKPPNQSRKQWTDKDKFAIPSHAFDYVASKTSKQNPFARS